MEEQLEFFDSNVLVAASLPEHPHHEPCYARLAKLQEGKGSCAAHTLAETYNTLTKYRAGYGMAPRDAWEIVQYAKKVYRLVALTAEETANTIEAAASQGLTGPMIYDALLLACARKIHAIAIYTHNLKHFRSIAPDLAPRVHLP